jgi:putative glutamine amidotransferase
VTNDKPLIGITTTTRDESGVLRDVVNHKYSTGVAQAGGIPVLLPAAPELAAHYARTLDGIVLSGGEDIDPSRYGAARDARTGTSNELRDEFEFALLAHAQKHETPVLGICRGQQVLAVFTGGTLMQDTSMETPNNHLRTDAPRDTLSHDVVVEQDSRLAHILGARTLPVNSLHHQAVSTVSAAIRVSARSTDQLIEGLESTGSWWVQSVQWHPEELLAHAQHRALFEALVSAANEHRSRRG